MSEKKVRGKPFQKGNNMNPKGAGAHCPQLRAIKLLTKAQIAEIISMIANNDDAAFNRLKKDKTTSKLQRWVIAMVETAIKKGDHHAFEALLCRTIGKVKEDQEITIVSDKPLVQIYIPKRDPRV